MRMAVPASAVVTAWHDTGSHVCTHLALFKRFHGRSAHHDNDARLTNTAADQVFKSASSFLTV